MNYKLLIHRNGESVHLKPVGDFDAGSARELAETQDLFARRGMRLFIHTNSLNKIDPYGLEEYHRRVSIPPSDSGRVVYTGENRDVFLRSSRKTA